MMYMPEIRTNTWLLTTLAERWYSKACKFHLSTSKMSVTLENVYMILWVSIHGDLMIYDWEGDRDALRWVFRDPDLELRPGHLSWEVIASSGCALTTVLGGIISGYLCPDKATWGLAIRWSLKLEIILIERRRFAWGPCILAHLYHELNQFVYLIGYRLRCMVTLLQMWAFENIVVTRPIHFRFRDIGQ